MLPLRDTNPTSRFAVVTFALILINVAVYFLVEPIRSSVNSQAQFFVCHAAIPRELTTGAPPICTGKNVYLAVLTSMFLHGSLLHLGGNMLFLWIFGNNVEDRLGRFRYLIFYLACGLAATLAQTLIDTKSGVPMIGASGAIAGVLGAYLFLYPRARVTTLIFFFFVDLPAFVVLAGWFLLQVFNGVGSIAGRGGGVAYFAHIGGFIAGAVLLTIFLPRSRRIRRLA